MTSRHPLRRIAHAFAAIRFMLIMGGMVAFILAIVTAQTVAGAMQNTGWLLLCATAMFIDPENPPKPPAEDSL